MSVQVLAALAACFFLLSGCVQHDTADYAAPEEGDPALLKGKNTHADELYMNSDTARGGRDFRNVFIAPAQLDHIQIIQAEGAQPDEEWQVSDFEGDILHQAMVSEFTAALSFESAYNVVEARGQSEMVIHTTVVAIHPNATRAGIAAGAESGGAITASIALVNSETGAVMVRSVETRSSDDIWAFNQVNNEDPAIRLIFRSWGNSIRRGLLHLQGRSSDPLAQPVNTKEQ